jgi:hypothetical protein
MIARFGVHDPCKMGDESRLAGTIPVLDDDNAYSSTKWKLEARRIPRFRIESPRERKSTASMSKAKLGADLLKIQGTGSVIETRFCFNKPDIRI